MRRLLASIQGLWARLMAPLQALPSNVRGAIYVMTAGMIFTASSGFVKEMSGEITVFQILLIRQATMTLTVLPVLARNFPDALRTRSLKLQFARVVFALMAMVGGFLAIQHMPLADATALSFAKSLFVPVFALIFLKEIAGLHRWAATLVGFGGVLIIVQPGAHGIDLFSAYALAGAAGAAMVMIIIRHLSQFDRSVTILSYQAILVGAVMLPLGVWYWVWPTWQQWLMMLGIGLLSVAGQFANIAGYRAGEPTAVAPMDYARMVFAALIGLVVFLEVPSWSTIAGSALIIATSFYTIRHERHLARRR
ncbi:MAG: DMT family transporter [Alphaproteobacteria bacterium]|nr:DMT family transporter [Alphaproteobacteria bacterium]